MRPPTAVLAFSPDQADHDPFPQTESRASIPAAATLLAFSVAWVLHSALTPSPGHRFMDWQVYQLGGRAVLNGSDLYGFRAPHGGPFTYPPFAGLLFTPFRGCSVTVGGLVMAVATLGALAIIVVILVRHATPAPLPAVLVACAVLIQTDAVAGNISWGQLNLVLAALVVADLLLPRTPWPRGAATGLAAAVKVTPALFIVYLLAAGRYRTARNAVLTGTALTAATWLALPDASRTYWFHALWETRRVGPKESPGNHSVWGLILRLQLPVPFDRLVLATALLTLFLVVMTRAARAARAGDELLAVTLIGFLGCILSPITWSHHVVWLIPAVALLLTRRTWWTWPAVVALVLFSMTSLHDLIGDQGVAAQTMLLILLALALPVAGRTEALIRHPGIAAPSTGRA
jgi:alpha-1,2-mannosyltransferase